VGQDAILRVGWQPALCGFGCKPAAGTNPLQVANLPYKQRAQPALLLSQRFQSAALTALVAGRTGQARDPHSDLLRRSASHLRRAEKINRTIANGRHQRWLPSRGAWPKGEVYCLVSGYRKLLTRIVAL
jgi:hypothetical protein